MKLHESRSPVVVKSVATHGNRRRLAPDFRQLASILLDSGHGSCAHACARLVRGQPVDPRTDIFALGVVVCEMLTGAAPFRRETSAETLTAILKDDPPGQPTTTTGIRATRHTVAEGAKS